MEGYTSEIKFDIIPLTDEYYDAVIKLLDSEFSDSVTDILYFKDLVKYNKRSFYIMVVDYKLVGVISLCKHYSNLVEDLSPWITKLAIAEEYRVEGLGRILVEHILSVAKKRMYNRVHLTSEAHNEAFYVKLGWTPTDRILHFKGDWVERVFYKDI